MIIKTKYDIDETVWLYMKHHNPKPVSYKIKQIQVVQIGSDTVIRYCFCDMGNPISYDESVLYSTKEACEANSD